jgi:hypothetical protein
MPFDEWPQTDRMAWLAAVHDGDPFDGRGPAAHWRPGTMAKVMSSYGRWLTFLQHRQALDPMAQPADRTTPEQLRAFVAELRQQVAPVTLAQRITDLSEALRVMAPGTELPELRRVQRALAARARPVRDKRRRYVHPARLLDLALRLMDRAKVEPGEREVWRADQCRDALMLAILTLRAARRRNLAAMTLGRHIERIDGRYVLRFDGTETKNHRPFEASLPEELTPRIDRYLDVWRPVLLRGRRSDRLWISNRGTDLAEHTIYVRMRALTEHELGVALNPHAFRDGPPTALAIDDPARVRAGGAILGHCDPRTAEEAYNLAQALDAARRYQDGILSLRHTRESAKLRCKASYRGRK